MAGHPHPHEPPLLAKDGLLKLGEPQIRMFEVDIGET